MSDGPLALLFHLGLTNRREQQDMGGWEENEREVFLLALSLCSQGRLAVFLNQMPPILPGGPHIWLYLVCLHPNNHFPHFPLLGWIGDSSTLLLAPKVTPLLVCVPELCNMPFIITLQLASFEYVIHFLLEL